MIFEAHTINAEHKDLIHDVAYDFYGQRMATCSSDQFVKVSLLQSCGLNEFYTNLQYTYIRRETCVRSSGATFYSYKNILNS